MIQAPLAAAGVRPASIADPPVGRLIIATIGTATNGMCPTSCTHERNTNAGGLPLSNEITPSDITSQIAGP
jgi:hypothetical protein